MNDTLLWLLIGAFASHRLALMVTKEDGPAWVFRKIRHLPPPKSNLKAGITCIFCMSVWSSAIVCYLLHWTLALSWSQWIVFWLAQSSGAIVINQSFTKGEI